MHHEKDTNYGNVKYTVFVFRLLVPKQRVSFRNLLVNLTNVS